MATRPRVSHITIAVLCALLAPVLVNTNLRWTYRQTLAHWRSKIIAPDRVFIGDSLTAGGGDFGHFGNINLGITGASTKQIVALLPIAQRYGPREIIVMAGMNDIDAGTDDPVSLAAQWRTILADRRVTVTLLPHTNAAMANVRIDRINAMISSMARAAGRRVVMIENITGASGLRNPDSTTDGVHFTPRAYAQWIAALNHST